MRQLGRIAIGYVAACLVAAAGLQAQQWWADPHVANATWSFSIVMQGLAGFTMLVGVFVSPLALVAILVAEWMRIRWWIFYVGAGLGAGAALPLTFGMDTGMTATGVCAGPVAGAVYWWIAGRQAGSWKRIES